MKNIKYIYLFAVLLITQQLFAQDFIPKFVEPDFSTFIDTTKLKLPELFNNLNPIQPEPVVKMEEPQIDNFPKDWEAFRKAFLALKLPKEYQYFYENLSFMNQWYKDELAHNFSTKVRWNPLNPIQSLYNAFSKEEKEKRKYNQLMQADYVEKIVGEKCPAEVVKIITGITSDSLVYAFFRFCDFSQEQIERATPHEVCELVSAKWQLFTGCKNEGDFIIDPKRGNY